MATKREKKRAAGRKTVAKKAAKKRSKTGHISPSMRVDNTPDATESAARKRQEKRLGMRT